MKPANPTNPSATGQNRTQWKCHGWGDLEDAASDVVTQQENKEEPRFFGSCADRLQAWEAQGKEKIYERLANYMTDQLQQGFSTQDLGHSVKDFPTFKKVPLAMAPELEKDIFAYLKAKKDNSGRATEVTLKSIHKGIASSINAIGPLAEVS